MILDHGMVPRLTVTAILDEAPGDQSMLAVCKQFGCYSRPLTPRESAF